MIIILNILKNHIRKEITSNYVNVFKYKYISNKGKDLDIHLSKDFRIKSQFSITKFTYHLSIFPFIVILVFIILVILIPLFLSLLSFLFFLSIFNRFTGG